MEAFGYSNNGRKLLTLREVTLHLSKMELDRLIEFLMIVRSRHQEIALEIGEQDENKQGGCGFNYKHSFVLIGEQHGEVPLMIISESKKRLA